MNKYLWATILIIVLFASFNTYTYFELQDLHSRTAELTTALKQTNNNINQLTTSTQNVLDQLGQDLHTTRTELSQNLTNVKSSVTVLSQQSQQQFHQLGSELTNVRQEQQENLEALEERLSLSLKTGDFTSIIEDVIKSVVSIQTDVSLGSGAFIEDDGIIVTNYHVIDDATAAAVITHDGNTHQVSILGYDDGKDIAILKIEDDYPHLKFSNNAKVGQRVIALGNPGGLQFTVTEGIISATNREANGNTYLQTDVPINPGNSGGPLVNAQGRIVGINTLKIKDFEGIGFAIPAEQVETILDDVLP